MSYNSKRECVSIGQASKSLDSYYYDYNLTNEFVLRQGDKNRHHFAFKSGNGGGDGETDLHRDAKMWLVRIKEFKYNDCVIKAHSVKYEEATIQESSRIPDVTFYDEQGDILCIIEVVNTNSVSEEKEQELKEIGILTFEAVIKNGSYKEFESVRYFGNKQIEGFRGDSKKRVERNIYKSESIRSSLIGHTKEERERSLFRIAENRERSRIRMEGAIENSNGFQVELNRVQEDVEREVRESALESYRLERESTERRVGELTERVNELRYELQRKEDLLSREVDEESNFRIGERVNVIKDHIERKQHEVHLSENRIKSVGNKLEKARCLN